MSYAQSIMFFKYDFVQKIFQLILLLPSGFSLNCKKAAAMKIVGTFQDQINTENGSDAKYFSKFQTLEAYPLLLELLVAHFTM
jgi:hypothetical protein